MKKILILLLITNSIFAQRMIPSGGNAGDFLKIKSDGKNLQFSSTVDTCLVTDKITVPNQSANDSTTNAANTAFVDRAITSLVPYTGPTQSLTTTYNVKGNNFISNYDGITASASTTTLTLISGYRQVVTGATTHTIVFPDARTLRKGHSFLITNLSTGNVTPKANDGTTANGMRALIEGEVMMYTCSDTSTQVGTWRYASMLPANVNGSYGKNTMSLYGTDLTAQSVTTTSLILGTTYTAIPTYSVVAGSNITVTPVTSGSLTTFSVTAASATLTNWTEGLSSTSTNSVTPVVSFSATNAGTNVDAVIFPKGWGSFMLQVPDGTTTGGNKRGKYSADFQTSRSAANQICGDDYSGLFGINNRISGGGAYNFLTGNTNVLSGCISSSAAGDVNTLTSTTSTHIFGSHISSTASYAAAFGYGHTHGGTATFATGQGHTTSGLYTVVEGRYGDDNGKRCRFVKACDNDALAVGVSQKSDWVLAAKTTGTVSVVMTSDASGASAATNQINLQNNSVYYMQGTIVAKQSSSSNVAVWTVSVRIYRGANAASTTVTGATVTAVENTPGWGTPTLTADTTYGGLQIGVSGATATNVRWTFSGTTTEVVY